MRFLKRWIHGSCANRMCAEHAYRYGLCRAHWAECCRNTLAALGLWYGENEAEFEKTWPQLSEPYKRMKTFMECEVSITIETSNKARETGSGPVRIHIKPKTFTTRLVLAWHALVYPWFSLSTSMQFYQRFAQIPLRATDD